MWTVVRQPRKDSFIYRAQWKPRNGASRSVLLGAMPLPRSKMPELWLATLAEMEEAGDDVPDLTRVPTTMELTERFRALDPYGSLDDASVWELAHDPTGGTSVGIVLMQGFSTMIAGHEARTSGARNPFTAPFTAPAPESAPAGVVLVPPAAAPVVTGPAAMALRDYVDKTWKPVRAQQKSTWEHEIWWWDQRILPVLGDVRLCDLDATRWTAFLATLTVGGRSKALCQTAYRTALTHAVEVLEWLPAVHRFVKIVGSTKRTRAEPEPMTAEEVQVFLAAAPSRTHRAMFALQIGQGLRPSEVIGVDWSHVDWIRGTLRACGTKNDLATAIVPLTPISRRELHEHWLSSGSPTSGPAFLRTRRGGAYPSFPRSAFRTTARKSGLNEGRVRKLFPYVARHSFATIAASAGIDRAHTKAMMRHSRQSTVLDEAYIRVSKEATAVAFAGFGEE